MAETMAKPRATSHTSVADVLRAAGVSRETFYEQFTSKEDCFMAAYDAAAGVAAGGVSRSRAGARRGPAGAPSSAASQRLPGGAGRRARVRRDMFLVEVYAAGAEAIGAG